MDYFVILRLILRKKGYVPEFAMAINDASLLVSSSLS